MSMLVVLYLAKLFSPSQVDRFFTPLAKVALRVRPRVRSGDPVPYRLADAGVPYRLADLGGTSWRLIPLSCVFTLACRDPKIVVDGETVWDYPEYFCCNSLVNAFDSRVFRYGKPGCHRVHLAFTFEVNGPDNPPNRGAPDWQRNLDFDAEFEVLAATAPDPLKLARSPALDEWATRNITICDSGDRTDYVVPHLVVGVGLLGSPPVAFAFDVFAESGDSRAPLGRVYLTSECKSGLCIQEMAGKLPPGADPDNLSITLLCSPAAARDTTDLDEIWGGNLRFRAVRLTRRPQGCWMTIGQTFHGEVFEAPESQPTGGQ